MTHRPREVGHKAQGDPGRPVAAQVAEGVEEGHVGAAHAGVADTGEKRHHRDEHAVRGHLYGRGKKRIT